MLSNLKDMFYKKEPPVAIQHIVKPRWLDKVVVKRYDKYFKIDLWNTVSIYVKDDVKLRRTYKVRGDYDRRELNLLGDNKIDFITMIGLLEVNQCFSMARSVLLNRIAKNGDDSGELFTKYEDCSDKGILIKKTSDGEVLIHSELKLQDELLINDLMVSAQRGPIDISKKYGKPDTILKLAKINTYEANRSVSIQEIIFNWGDESTKYSIKLHVDITSRLITLEILVR